MAQTLFPALRPGKETDLRFIRGQRPPVSCHPLPHIHRKRTRNPPPTPRSCLCSVALVVLVPGTCSGGRCPLGGDTGFESAWASFMPYQGHCWRLAASTESFLSRDTRPRDAPNVVRTTEMPPRLPNAGPQQYYFGQRANRVGTFLHCFIGL